MSAVVVKVMVDAVALDHSCLCTQLLVMYNNDISSLGLMQTSKSSSSGSVVEL